MRRAIPGAPVDEADGVRRGGGQFVGDQRKMRAGVDDRIDPPAAVLPEQAV